MKRSLKILMLSVLLAFSLAHAASLNVIAPEQIAIRGLTISTPGLYVLTDDVVYAAGGTALTIAADHVTLDLNGKTIQGAEKGETGILIAAGKKNISIKHGGVSGFSSSSIRAEAGTNNLSFSQVTLTGPKGGAEGFRFAGEATAPIFNVTIEQCHASSFDKGIQAINVHAVHMVDSSWNGNRKAGIEAHASDNWRLTTCQASHQNGTGPVAGIICAGGKGWSLRNSDFSSNSGAAAYGVLFNVTASGCVGGSHEITSCSFSNNGGFFARGLDLIGANACVVKDCVFNGNCATKSAARGLNVAGVGHYVEGCQADGNCATTSEPFAATGIVVTGSAHSIIRCHVAGNVSQKGLGIGILTFASSERCLIQNCTAVSNSSAGFQDDAKAGTNLWAGNLSWGHGEKNYVGTGQGFISFAAGKQPVSGTFDERGMDNISVM